jgi:hypothetical protein
MIGKIRAWLNVHPMVKGALVVAEGAFVGTMVHAVQSGGVSFTRQNLTNLSIALLGAMYLAVKNYLTTQAKALPPA